MSSACAARSARELEGEADDALGAVPREERRLHRDFIGPPGMTRAADLRVLAFGVLADDHEVDVARRLPTSGLRTPGYSTAGRTHAYWSKPRRIGSSMPSQRDVIRQPRVADRAEENRVEAAQLIQRVGRHHAMPCSM